MVERINAIDSMFLDESSEDGPPLAIGTCLVLPGRAPHVSEVRELLASRKALMPRLFQRLKRSRVREIIRASWVDDDPDLRHHVTVSHIGDDPRGLAGAVAKVMERPMDRSRPLWDVTLFPALPGAPGWALVFRVHHTVADGEAAVLLLGQLCEMEPHGTITLTQAGMAVSSAHHRPAHPHQHAEAHRQMSASPGDALRSALGSLSASVDEIREIAGRIPDTARSLSNFLPRKATQLTGTPSDGRSWAVVESSLATVQAAGRQLGGTVNDVILAACAIGFTAVLRSRGSDPAGQEVRCFMPITLREPGDTTASNQVSILPVSLPLGVDDLREVLTRVHESTSIAKSSLGPSISGMLAGVVTAVVPNLVEELAGAQAPKVGGYFGDVCITNVIGPQFPVFFMGREIASMYPILPIGQPLLIGISIFSYNGNLEITVSGDDESWDDVELLARTITRSLDVGGPQPVPEAG